MPAHNNSNRIKKKKNLQLRYEKCQIIVRDIIYVCLLQMVKNPIPPYNRQSNQFIATTIIFFILIDADDNDKTPDCTVDSSCAIEWEKIKEKSLQQCDRQTIQPALPYGNK